MKFKLFIITLHNLKSLLNLISKTMAVISLDMGGTKIEGAVFRPDGSSILKRRTLLAGRQGEAVAEAAAAMARELLGEAIIEGEEISALGICVPGIVNRTDGTVWAPNIPGWECYPLRDHLRRAMPEHVEVYVDSDRSCAIYGATWIGAAAQCRNAVFVAVGTGIGVGIMSDGRVLHGAGDIAGASGWLALQSPYTSDYDECGCFESYASGNGIGAQARRKLAEGRCGSHLPGAKNIEDITSHDVFAAYEAGDEVAVEVIDKAIEMWGMAGANLVSLLNPEVVVWGGGVFGPATKFIDRIRFEAEKWAQPVAMKKVKFVPARPDINPVLCGAAYIALNQYV